MKTRPPNLLLLFPDQHRSVWYQASGGIPLIVSGPGMRRGVVSEALVQRHDLAATFLDAAGAPALPDADALSLRPLLEGRTAVHRPHILGGLAHPKGHWDRRMACDGRYKLVMESGAPAVLFDRAADPFENINIADDHPDVVRRLADLIEQKRRGDGRPRPGGS